MLSVFSGIFYSYCIEVETGHYLLFDRNNKSSVYLQGDAARTFRKEIENIDNMIVPDIKPGLLIENTISMYL